MKILVLGATGSIGRRVVPLLISRGHEVTAAGRSSERLAQLGKLGATQVTLDILDVDAVSRTMNGHATVVNLVTKVPGTGPRAFLPGAWREMDLLRRDGSAIVADAAIAAGVERLIQESFALTYPDRGAQWVDETTLPEPAAYNRTTLDAEASADRVTKSGSIGVALRFALLYGGAEDGFTRDVLRFARRGWLPLLGCPDGYVSMVTHDDAARAVVAALDAPPGIYNVVDDDPLTRSELAQVLGDVLSVPRPKLLAPWMAWLGGSLGETIARSLRLCNKSFRDATGWRAEYPSGREGWRAGAGTA